MKKLTPKLTPKRKAILDYIESFSIENGYPPSVREIGAAVGLRSPSTVHAHISALREGGWLEKDDHKMRALAIPGKKQKRLVPILGRVQAGAPILATEEVVGHVSYDGSLSGEFFALTVRGDSMINAGILEDDVIIIRQQSDARSGDIVVALIDDEATVKRLIKKDGRLTLMPENPSYTPIDGEGCSILGIAVALYRPRV